MSKAPSHIWTKRFPRVTRDAPLETQFAQLWADVKELLFRTQQPGGGGGGGGGADTLRTKVFTLSLNTTGGAGIWTPPTGVTGYWIALATAAGGGGRSYAAVDSGAGGGAGENVMGLMSACEVGTDVNVVLGAIGAGGNNSAGGNGGDCTVTDIVTTYTIKGGKGAPTQTGGAGGGPGGGAGGIPSSTAAQAGRFEHPNAGGGAGGGCGGADGSINPGAGAGNGYPGGLAGSNGSGLGGGGGGGGSPFGPGGNGGTASNGQDGQGYGAGGGGSSGKASGNYLGGNGGGPLVVLAWIGPPEGS